MEWTKELFSQIETDVKPAELYRIGKRNPEKGTRSGPIKVVLAELSDKLQVMTNLKKLKLAPVHLKRVRITDDYSPEEREMIKIKIEEAKKLNDEDNSTFHMVKGNPKEGLRIIKVARLTTQNA